MSETFEGTYEVDDGYVGKGRPKPFEIDADDLDDDMTDDEIAELYDNSARDAFEQEVTYYTNNGDEFLAWAREQLAARKEEEEHE